MKSAKGQIERAIARPDPGVRFYLFHGPDEAGSRALALRLLKGLGDAEKFVVVGASVKSDPASLADEAGAMSLFGGKRAIWIEPAGEEILDGVAALLDAPGGESAVIAIAGTLKRGSGLLKLAEAHRAALAHVSYVPEGRGMAEIVAELGRRHGLAIGHDVAERIGEASGFNQAIAEREVEKYATYLSASADRLVSLELEVLDLLESNHGEVDLMRLGDLALAGKMDELLDDLGQLPGSGSDAIPIVRAVQRRLLMLAPLRAQIEAGRSRDDVMTSMGKALFWKDKPLIGRLLSSWPSSALAEAAARVGALEKRLIFGDGPSDAELGETMVSLARASRRSR
ncbi:DNA polymerase III subunit delta [Sphingomonas sp. ASV193]|uniref:DNA polymerase III subunit delta n=1 Tax=Sphingomonas sp. ASV193 TaxID=3144405 RepID=UPI0032E8E7B8